MTTPRDEIDWDEAERRQRRRRVQAIPFAVAFFAGTVLLTGRFGFWTDNTAWVAVGIFLLVLMLILATWQSTQRVRDKNSAAYRIEAALRQHVDPGPDLRERADRQARYSAATGWVGWAVLIGPFTLVPIGQWDRPLAAAMGAVLVVGGAVAWFWWWRGQLINARRWVADPPGPPREPLPPTARERWLTGRRGLAVAFGAALILALLGGLVAALIGGF